MDRILSKIPRKIAPSCVPLAWVGTEYRKKHTINRLFDHIALSLIWGENMKVRLENQYTVEEFTEPVCVIALPGDHRKMTPVHSFDELYFVYEASALPHLLPELPEDPALFRRSILLKDIPAGEHLLHAAEALLNQRMTPEFAFQLDLIGTTLLTATFRYPHKKLLGEEMLMTRFQNYICSHYKEDICWDDVGKECGVGFQTFRKIWRKYSQTSPYQTVMELRNHDAKNLLKDLTLSIQEIAAILGYSDPHYFSRIFRKWNGITPTQYRHSHIAKRYPPSIEAEIEKELQQKVH